MRKKKLCGLGLTAAFCTLLLGGTSAPASVEANQKVFRTVTPEDNARAQALQSQADEARLAGDYARAIDLYTKAIHINERLGGYDGRAYCRFLLGDYDAAERDALTALYNRSADDLMKAGISGLAEYVHGMCLYKKGHYEEAEHDLKAVLGTRYASDEVTTAYADCREKAEAAREAAMLEKFRTSSAAFAAKVQTELSNGSLRAYDATRGEIGWWRDDASRELFETTMMRPDDVSSDEFLHSFTQYLWILTFEKNTYPDMVVAFIPRHNVYSTADQEMRKDDVFVTEVTGAGSSQTIDTLHANTRLQYRYSIGKGRFLNNMNTDSFTWESLAAEKERRINEEGFHFGVSIGERWDIQVDRRISPTEYYVSINYGNPVEVGYVTRLNPDGRASQPSEVTQVNENWRPPTHGYLRRIDQRLPPL